MTNSVDNFIVHWVRDIPVAYLKPAVNEMLPPGSWAYFEQFQKLMDEAIAQLESLHGNSMRGRLCICISKNLDQIALVELPGLQKELELDRSPDNDRLRVQEITPIDKQSISTKTLPSQAWSVSNGISKSIEVAEALLTKNDAGEYIPAEMLLDALNSSPDPKLTANVLKTAGYGTVIHGVDTSFNPGRHRRFPETVESRGQFLLRFSNVVDVGQNEVRADFKRIHVPGQFAETGLGELLKTRQRLSISLAGSQDAMLFRVGGVAELEVEANVTLTLLSFERSIKRFTLVRLADREQVLAKLDLLIEQFRLPLEGT